MMLTFGAKSADCISLEKTLIGRKDLVDEVYNELYEKSFNEETYQSLIVAPRGSGKTHLTKVIYCRLKKAGELKDKIVIAYMVEDEYGIVNFLHFCLRILMAIDRYNELPDANIKKEIQRISEMPNKEQTKAVTSYLRTLLGKKKLIVLAENFDNLLKEMENNGAALRDFMHEYNNISLVTTAQNLTKQFNDSKYPFYNFFKTRHLKKLSFEQAFELIKALIDVEDNEDIKKNLQQSLADNNEVKSRLRAIYELTGGNHRLLVHFYGFVKADIKSDLSKVFVKQMNDLKSYYEQFVGNLSVQQQRIVQLLSLNHKPMQGKQISQQSFLEANVVSKQLSELFKHGFIDKHKTGKNVFYELREPIMRICFEINENPEGSAKLFVDFLKIMYNEEERKKQYLKFKLSAKHVDVSLQQSYLSEADIYEKTFSDEQKAELRPITEKLQKTNYTNLEKEIEKNLVATKSKKIKELYKLAEQHFDNEEFDLAIEAYKGAIKINPNDDSAYYNLGVVYYNQGEFDLTIEAYKGAININPNNDSAYYNLGNAYRSKGEYDLAIEAYRAAIKINPNDDSAFYNLGIVFKDKDDLNSALEAWKQVTVINPKNDDAYNNLGIAYKNKGKFDLAIKAYKQAINVNSNNFSAYYNLGNAYYYQGEFDLVVKALEKALGLNSEYSDIYILLALINLKVSKWDLALENIQKALEIEPNNPFYLGTSIQVHLYKNNWQNAAETLNKILSNNIEYTAPMVGEDIVAALFKWTPEHLILEQFKDVETYFTQKNKETLFYEAFTFAVFNILINIDYFSKERLQEIAKVVNHFSEVSDKVRIPNLYLTTGIDYLKNKNEEAIFNFSKEERKVFEEEVLAQRKHFIKTKN